MASAVDEAPPTATEPTADPFALDERLAALGGLGLDQLRAEWRRLHRAAPPVRLSRDLLLRSIAHRLQEDALGGLRPAAQRRLASLARGVAAEGEPAPAPARRPAQARHDPGPGVARPHPHRAGARRRRLRTRGAALRLADRTGPRHHRRPLVRAALLRPAARHQASRCARRGRPGRRCVVREGGRSRRARRPAAAPSTPASPPRRGWSRRSTASTRSARPARPSSAASATRAGSCCPPATTTAASPAAPWSGRRCSGCWPTSAPARSTWCWSTRWTG